MTQRDLATSAASSSQPSPWTSPSLGAFRIGGIKNYSHTIELSESGSNETNRKAIVKISSPSKEGSFNTEVIDFDGKTTHFSAALPTTSTSNSNPNSNSISTLLSNQLNKLDIISEDLTQSGRGGEKLHLFNVAENFVGQVEIVLPEWLEELKGGVSGPVGSARAPMRKSCLLSFKVIPRRFDTKEMS